MYSPKMTFSPLKATVRLMWPLVKMSLTPLYLDLFPSGAKIKWKWA